jgi:hypothetical protein
VPRTTQPLRHDWRIWRCASYFAIIPPIGKSAWKSFQLKGSALLWWKMLLSQLNMIVEDVSWELFEERFRERYLSEEFIKRRLNEFIALRQGGRTVPESEAHVMASL